MGAEEGYETCYAYYRIDGGVYEFAPGGAWIWSDCGEEEQPDDPACDGGWSDMRREDWQYDFEMEDWDTQGDWNCWSHWDCPEDQACSLWWMGWGDETWEHSQICVDW